MQNRLSLTCRRGNFASSALDALRDALSTLQRCRQPAPGGSTVPASHGAHATSSAAQPEPAHVQHNMRARRHTAAAQCTLAGVLATCHFQGGQDEAKGRLRDRDEQRSHCIAPLSDAVAALLKSTWVAAPTDRIKTGTCCDAGCGPALSAAARHHKRVGRSHPACQELLGAAQDPSQPKR